MNQTKTILLEQVSALADGQLDDEAFGLVMAHAAGQSGEVQAAWQRYHLIGDVLRAGQHERCTDQSAFVARLQQRIALEPSEPVHVQVQLPVAVALHRIEAANEPVFRWKLVAGLASVAAAVAIGWSWVGSISAPAGAQLAQAQPQLQPSSPITSSVLASSGATGAGGLDISEVPTTVAVGTEPPQMMLRNARLDELLAAHQQAAGGLQPSVFLRNATFERPSR